MFDRSFQTPAVFQGFWRFSGKKDLERMEMEGTPRIRCKWNMGKTYILPWRHVLEHHGSGFNLVGETLQEGGPGLERAIDTHVFLSSHQTKV